MTIKFSWSCPYCNREATITDSNFSDENHFFNKDSKDGNLCIKTQVVTCPNDKCREYTIKGYLFKATYSGGYLTIVGSPILTWSMKPRSFAKQFPDYIPEAIKADYEEACLIRDLSPKASATLSRRCIQGIIRDYWGVKKGRLVDEINDIKEKVDSLTWQAIDSVRSIGNIGAHMEKDINLIVDVEPKEAQLLIGLIEVLLKDWYVARQERKNRLESIINVAKVKLDEKKQKSDNGIKADE
jgi:hypothetical protein